MLKSIKQLEHLSLLTLLPGTFPEYMSTPSFLQTKLNPYNIDS